MVATQRSPSVQLSTSALLMSQLPNFACEPIILTD